MYPASLVLALQLLPGLEPGGRGGASTQVPSFSSDATAMQAIVADKVQGDKVDGRTFAGRGHRPGDGVSTGETRRVCDGGTYVERQPIGERCGGDGGLPRPAGCGGEGLGRLLLGRREEAGPAVACLAPHGPARQGLGVGRSQLPGIPPLLSFSSDGIIPWVCAWRRQRPGMAGGSTLLGPRTRPQAQAVTP